MNLPNPLLFFAIQQIPPDHFHSMDWFCPGFYPDLIDNTILFVWERLFQKTAQLFLRLRPGMCRLANPEQYAGYKSLIGVLLMKPMRYRCLIKMYFL